MCIHLSFGKFILNILNLYNLKFLLFIQYLSQSIPIDYHKEKSSTGIFNKCRFLYVSVCQSLHTCVFKFQKYNLLSSFRLTLMMSHLVNEHCRKNDFDKPSSVSQSFNNYRTSTMNHHISGIRLPQLIEVISEFYVTNNVA